VLGRGSGCIKKKWYPGQPLSDFSNYDLDLRGAVQLAQNKKSMMASVDSGSNPHVGILRISHYRPTTKRILNNCFLRCLAGKIANEQ
jgi:hypothetical protein